MLKIVGYHKRTWPFGSATLQEAAAHFDVKGLSVAGSYSLHTEYAAGCRQFRNTALNALGAITAAHQRGIPQLWKSKEWANQFAAFVIELTQEAMPPEVIEIHPPFNDYCPSFSDLILHYKAFESEIARVYPSSLIVIENRHGTRYTGGKFLVSRREDLLALTDLLDATDLSLNLCLDVPQLFSAHFGPAPRTEDDIDRVLTPLMECRHRIASVHMWGKKRNKRGGMQAHYGTLDTWLGPELKRHLLRRLHELLDDDRTRYFVPEVNGSQSDMDALARDMIEAGFTFC